MVAALVLVGSVAYGQFGARLGYTSLQSSAGNEMMSSAVNAYHLGANYWYRLENYRVEFFPEITYQNAFDIDQSSEILDQIDQIGIVLPIQFYPFDFVSDCSCPTFSKQSRVFQKGFFLFASGGYMWGQTNNPLAGGGAGFDYGLNDLLTISLLAEYRHYFRDSTIQNPMENAWLIGIRTSFRPDYKRSF